ncbi:hypothetical protein ACJ73_06992 [Blastomyces percursus]|uniref:SAC3/GANP/THP3 conserved domain-containing protein n=1 Tax=Blastomyces percursus TaxID=1658174 RepID=A0A1J9Q0M5_9EURO|nr:hypothetical protein ACJ73_06992 [Blastomyces percursus]
MSATSRGSMLTGSAGFKRGAAGPPSARGRVWRGSTGGSRPSPGTDDSTRGAKTRAAARGGSRGGRGRRGDISVGTTIHPNGVSSRPSSGPFRGVGRGNLENGSRPRSSQEHGVKAPVFGSRSATSSGQSSQPSSPFGMIAGADGSLNDHSRDPRRRNGKFSGGSAKFGMPQDYNSRYEQLKLDRARQRAEAIKTGQMADPNQPMSLTSAITPTGTCIEMCPEFERVERIVQKMVDKSEKFTDPESMVSHTVEAKMLKRFRRSAAGYDEQLPSDIRTPQTLLQTMNYLLRHVVVDDETLALTHKFLWDRTRSIRNDLSIQQLTQAQDVAIAVKCLERIARFHIVSLHLLSSPENSEPFDHHQEREQLNNTLLSLLYYYDDNRDLIKFPNEDEFRAYYIVFSIHDQRPDLEARVQKWPRELLQSPRVQVALELFAAAGNTWEYQGTLDAKRPNAIAQGLYARFFRVIQSNSVPYLLACIAEIYFNQVRQTAIRSIWKAYCRHPLSQQPKNQEWTVDELTGALGFDDNDQTIEFCEEQGLQFATNPDGHMYLNWGQFPLDSVAFQPSSQQTFSYEHVESKRCGRTLVALILGMNVLQAAEHGMIDQSLLQADSAFQQNSKENVEGDGLFVSDDKNEAQARDTKGGQSDKAGIGAFKPAFSFPSVEDPGLAANMLFQGTAGQLVSPSGSAAQQMSLPTAGQLSPTAPSFNPQGQSPFITTTTSSPFGAKQQLASSTPIAAQPPSTFEGFGQPSRNLFPSSQATPQSTLPTFSSTFGANLGSSQGSNFGSSFGVQKDNQLSQNGPSAPIALPCKPATPTISSGQLSSSQLGTSTPSQTSPPSTSAPFAPSSQSKEATTALNQSSGAADSAQPRDSLFRPFPSAQPGKRPSVFDKGTPPAPFVSSGNVGQLSKIAIGDQTTNANGISSIFSATPAAPALKKDQVTTKPTPTSNIFSSPFPSPAESPAFKAPAPKFEFTSSIDKPKESKDDIDARKAAEREAAEKRRKAEEMEAKRIEFEKREAARREIEWERDRRRAAAEEAARLERLEKARKEEEMLRARQLEEEKAKAAEREAALREMARQQEEELRAAELEIAKREAAEREAARHEAAKRELIEQDIAKRKADSIEEEDETSREQYRASRRISEGLLTVEELLSLDRPRMNLKSSQRPQAQPPPPASRSLTDSTINEDELLFAAARMAANTLANGKNLWHHVPEFGNSMTMPMSMSMSPAPASTPRFIRSSIGPDSSKRTDGPHVLVNGYDVALAPTTRLGLGRTLSRTEQRIRQTGAKGFASLPIASSPSPARGTSASSGGLLNGKVQKRKHKRQKKERDSC